MLFYKNHKENPEEALSTLTIPIFGYELIRETLLKDLLGKDYKPILYWGGKSLARKYPLQSIKDITSFFEKSGWGKLDVVKEGKNELLFNLTSEWISNRLSSGSECSFQLEAGFLAEQIQHIINHHAEAMEQQKKKSQLITFTVQWD